MRLGSLTSHLIYCSKNSIPYKGEVVQMKNFILILALGISVIGMVGCVKNPTGPTPACALCAQQTETAVAATQTAIALLGTPTSTPTNVVSIPTATVTTTSTSVIVATATATATSTTGTVASATSTATATVTITPISASWQLVVQGPPNTDFQVGYGKSDFSSNVTWTFSGTGHTDASGNWNGQIFQTNPTIEDCIVDGFAPDSAGLTVDAQKNGSSYWKVKPAAKVHFANLMN